MLKFDSVTKEYKDGTKALEEVSFAVSEGEFLFITGPSGAGKTTLIKLLIREELLTEGEIIFNDLEISSVAPGKLPDLRRQIGVVYQDFKLIPNKTVYENVAFALEVLGKSDEEVEEKVEEVLDTVDLSDRYDLFPHNLSGGEKQRAALARAISLDPKVLIADEATGNIDKVLAWGILDLMDKFNKSGTTVIMTTHETDFVKSLKKREVRLEGGRVVKDQKA